MNAIKKFRIARVYREQLSFKLISQPGARVCVCVSIPLTNESKVKPIECHIGEGRGGGLFDFFSDEDRGKPYDLLRRVKKKKPLIIK